MPRQPGESGNNPETYPSYLSLGLSELQSRAVRAMEGLSRCAGCAVACLADRLSGTTGDCRSGRYARVSGFFPHFGEEPPISGWRGSGTIFFSGCNLRCIYCQNHETSQTDEGEEITERQLADVMLRIQDLGCHNINLVTPSHVVPQFLAALALAVPDGLRLPIVYNTGGYDSLATLRLLDGVVDIYMPDAKYDDDQVGLRLSGIPHYAKVNRLVLKEMHRQVGVLQTDANGVAVRGLLIRHLVLPGHLSGIAGIARFIASQLSGDAYANVMSQYRPCYNACQYESLDRRLTWEEYAEAVAAARSAGLWQGLPSVSPLDAPGFWRL
ncbi:MAG: radical SAM protein [Chloroflexi bacterium]|nr:radical SAM protein [Chloroflexota bacterium]